MCSQCCTKTHQPLTAAQHKDHFLKSKKRAEHRTSLGAARLRLDSRERRIYWLSPAGVTSIIKPQLEERAVCSTTALSCSLHSNNTTFLWTSTRNVGKNVLLHVSDILISSFYSLPHLLSVWMLFGECCYRCFDLVTPLRLNYCQFGRKGMQFDGLVTLHL